MNDLLTTLGMLGIFHAIGGAALGSTLRKWIRRDFSSRSLFMLVWGGMFGVIPLGFGASFFNQHNAPFLVGVEIGILAGAILLVALVPDWFLGSFDRDTLVPAAIGALFLLVGVGIGLSLLGSEPGTALILMVIFGGSGAAVLALMVWRAFKA